MQSKLNPFLHCQEGGKCPLCTSHTVKLIPNVTRQGAKSQLFFSSQVFLPLLLKHKEIQHNGGSFLSVVVVTTIHPQKENWRTATMTSHVCGLCSSKIKDSPALEGQMVNGWVAQSALLFCFC